MDLKKIPNYLDTKFIGKNIIVLDKTDSTNSECKRNPEKPDGTVYIADIQTNGRGRLGRSWESPKGTGAYFSIILKPNLAPEYVSQITLAAGLAVCKAIKGKIKYPNDIVISTKKVCGILTEYVAGKSPFCICGIGINVNTISFPDELKSRATSLYIETSKVQNRSEIVARVLNEFEIIYAEFLKNGLKNIIDEYKENCVTIGNNVVVIKNSETISGKCTDITVDGKLIIETENKIITVNSGEVSVRGIYGYV